MDGPGWVEVDACTLPTVERPLRVAEFDDLFATLQSVEHTDPSRARMLLNGDGALAERTRLLAAAESSCCSFFTFDVSTPGPGRVAFYIGVPPEYVDELAALVDRANAVQGSRP